MSVLPGLTRRDVIRLVAAMAAAIPSAALAEALDADCWPWAAAVDLDGLRSLGEGYRSTYGDATGITEVDALLTRGEANASAAIQRLAAADYEAGRLVTVAGWHVSRTEGRLFAALAARC